MSITLRSFAKVNLGLRIGPARADGFHALATVYHTIDAHDLITLEVKRGAGLRLSCTDRRVPLDGRNTVHKMLTRALAGRPGLGVRVHIDKRLPIQGGLGAGSSNAAAALAGLESELARLGWAAPLAEPDRLRIAAEVGSDVPLFVLGGAVLGTGRGECVEPLPDRAENPVVIALPNMGVSTPEAFRTWDRNQPLTPDAQAGRLKEFLDAVRAVWAGQPPSGVAAPPGGDHAEGDPLSQLVQAGLCINDFESVVFEQIPFLRQLKKALALPGGAYASLSGSGSAVFGVYPDDAGAQEAEAELNTLGVRRLRTKLLSRAGMRAGTAAR